jgi:hypothetical protein
MKKIIIAAVIIALGCLAFWLYKTVVADGQPTITLVSPNGGEVYGQMLSSFKLYK